MAIVSRDQIKSWFRRGLKPLESHFASWIDSFWHKNDSIPMSSIDGLTNALNQRTITVDDALSDTSENPVQNKVLKTALDNIHVDVDSSLNGSSKNPVQNKVVTIALGNKADVEHTHQMSEVEGLNAALAGKQDSIEDLSDIRSGAALGATALQQHQDISGKQDKTDNSLLTTAKNIVSAINELWNKFADYLKGIQHVTYAQLKAKRDGGTLMPGQWYRITDYLTTVANDPDARSAGHPFDLLVMATSANTLSEEAKAVKSTRDSNGYFAEANLEAWKVWYRIDNDVTCHKWADTENGKGVIWRMIDEWGNDCPYDFKNVQFKRYAISDITTSKLTADALSNLKSTFCYDQNGGKCFATKDVYGNWVPQDSNGASYEIDEETFEWYYTFHGLSSEDGETIDEHYDMSTRRFKMTDECIQYQEDDGCGINSEDECHDNIIKPAYWEYDQDDEYYKGRQVLNNIVFINGLSYCYYNEDDEYWEYNSGYCYGNVFGVECKNSTFGNGCSDSTFGNNCYSNTFGNDCYNNTFGNNCGFNTFGNDCNSNTFGNNCWGNTFGNYCYYNTFGNYFRWNTFGNGCSSNTFGNGCNNNTFANWCYNNTFGNNCYRNTFGNDCYWNTFGNYFQQNTFGNNCWGNTFGNNCYSNTFGNYFRWNTFGNDCNSNTFGNGFQYNTFGNDCYNNTFGNNCNWNTFGNGCSSNTFGNYVRYLTVFDGIQYVAVTGGSSDSSYVQNAQILNGTKGANSNNRLQISFQSSANYCQIAGLNSSGVLKIWTPADAA